mmetsp:Transcript_9081/g.24945  ORF Transcript_9081/g.24945 Transcript_9081/m.24945 type:complete len:214 (+) Transcript_9081:326-967(+)
MDVVLLVGALGLRRPLAGLLESRPVVAALGGLVHEAMGRRLAGAVGGVPRPVPHHDAGKGPRLEDEDAARDDPEPYSGPAVDAVHLPADEAGLPVGGGLPPPLVALHLPYVGQLPVLPSRALHCALGPVLEEDAVVAVDVDPLVLFRGLLGLLADEVSGRPHRPGALAREEPVQGAVVAGLRHGPHAVGGQLGPQPAAGAPCAVALRQRRVRG